MAGYKDQALTLLAVKEGLGEFYDEQKNMFLDTVCISYYIAHRLKERIFSSLKISRSC